VISPRDSREIEGIGKIGRIGKIGEIGEIGGRMSVGMARKARMNPSG
jgi:hypothetical protein